MTEPKVETVPGAAAVQAGEAQPPPAATIRREVREDGICALTFDRPGSAANILDFGTLEELAAHLDFIEHSPDLKGVILSTAKPGVFIAGADLNVMRRGAAIERVRELIELGQSVMNRIAALSIPTAAAIHGAALGGGFEICLSCDHRVASSERTTRLGLPETGLGLLPAWGGATRLPRLIGLRPALEMILGGKPVKSNDALELGIVDELSASQDLLETALRRIRKGKRRASRRKPVSEAAAAATGVLMLRKLLKKTRGNYPAGPKALEVVTRGITRTVADSMILERNAILELVQTEACKNLIHLFFLEERARKRTLPGATPQGEPKAIRRAAVIGAGIMGAGIAQWLSSRKVEVALRDVTDQQLDRGMLHITKVYQDNLKREIITTEEMNDGLGRIQPAQNEVPPGPVDLVIEAAFEQMDVKKEIFTRLNKQTTADTILATNTSALPISDIASVVSHPERVLGLHFFNPVHRMQLIEIIPARETAPEVLERSLRFAQRIGKLPVIVQDVPGFVSNRLLTPYLNEAQRLFEGGASIKNLDEAMLDFGMPMGPMRLLDEIGLPVELHIAETLAACFGGQMRIPDCLRDMVRLNLHGRKSGRGYYLYEGLKTPKPNLDVVALARDHTFHRLKREELQERMVLIMINEAARCLEEKVVADGDDLDFVMVKGMGFAPFRGGLLRHADVIGSKRLVESMQRLVVQGADYFAPCELLRAMGERDGKFFGTE
jgi:3-hydroxyacyl-CoA dehydrogenase/enoyl-CoA hydratase/3-hydroxybutyryl-CoA epimerase